MLHPTICWFSSTMYSKDKSIPAKCRIHWALVPIAMQANFCVSKTYLVPVRLLPMTFHVPSSAPNKTQRGRVICSATSLIFGKHSSTRASCILATFSIRPKVPQFLCLVAIIISPGPPGTYWESRLLSRLWTTLCVFLLIRELNSKPLFFWKLK